MEGLEEQAKTLAKKTGAWEVILLKWRKRSAIYVLP